MGGASVKTIFKIKKLINYAWENNAEDLNNLKTYCKHDTGVHI
jgi:hypothetical protein